MMSRGVSAWLVAAVFLLAAVAEAEARPGPSPIAVMEEIEQAYRGDKEEVQFGRIFTVTYPANIVEIDESYYPQLIELSQALKTPARRNYRIVLRGYSSGGRSLDAGVRMSLQRAEALKNLLVYHPAMAISQDRIAAEGHGEAPPAKAALAGQEPGSRRVEIHLVGTVNGPSPGAGAFARQAEQAQAEAAAAPPSPERGLEAPEAVRLSLFDAIRYGLEGNQDIRVVSFTPKRAAEDLAHASSAYDPEFFADGRFRRDPNLQSSVTRVVMEDDGLVETGVRKPLPTGGSVSGSLAMRYSDLVNSGIDRTYKYTFAPTVEIRQPLLKNIGAKEEKTAITIASCQLHISEEEFRQKAIDIAARISRAYWQLYLLRQFAAIDQKSYEMAEEVFRRETVRVTEGLSQSIDVERARSNAQSRRGSLLQTRKRLQVAADQLKLLMNWSNLTIDSNSVVIPTEEPQTRLVDVREEEVLERALLHRPEAALAGGRLEISRAEESLFQHRRLPKLDVFGRYAVSGYSDEFSDSFYDTTFNQEDSWAVGVNFAYPIGNRSAEARARSKSIERRQSEVRLERIRNHIKQDVKEVLLAIEFAGGEIESTRKAKLAARKVVEGEFTRFEIGQTTNEELLRAQDLLAATSRNYVRAVVDYNIARAELVRAQGLLPEGITVDATP